VGNQVISPPDQTDRSDPPARPDHSAFDARSAPQRAARCNLQSTRSNQEPPIYYKKRKAHNYHKRSRRPSRRPKRPRHKACSFCDGDPFAPGFTHCWSTGPFSQGRAVKKTKSPNPSWKHRPITSWNPVAARWRPPFALAAACWTTIKPWFPVWRSGVTSKRADHVWITINHGFRFESEESGQSRRRASEPQLHGRPPL